LFAIKPSATSDVLNMLTTAFALLVMYGFLVMWATTGLEAAGQLALGKASTLGLIGGAVVSASTTLANFMDIHGTIFGPVVLATLFTLFIASGYRSAHNGGSIGSGMKAGVWSGIVCVLVKVTVSFLVVCVLVPSPQHMATSPAFRSHHGYTVYAWFVLTTVDSAGNFLLMGPILGAAFGLLGGIAARLRRKNPPVLQPQNA
jgi:hypothetical protein